MELDVSSTLTSARRIHAQMELHVSTHWPRSDAHVLLDTVVPSKLAICYRDHERRIHFFNTFFTLINSCSINTDECASSPCYSVGADNCTDLVNAFRCNCKPGFTGAFCDQLINECLSNPCLNGATCIDGLAMFTCTCATGWQNTTCSQRVDKCLTANPCLNGANCTNGLTDAAPTCLCAAGYTGATCSVYSAVCNPNPCQNQGQCSPSANQLTAVCTCSPSFTGSRCETPVDFCAGQTCSNAGRCVASPATASYTCICDSGFEGVNCATSRLFH